MNAAVLVGGQAAGGAEGAKAALEHFWRRVSDAALLSPFRRRPLDVLLGRWTLDTSPVFVALDLMARIFSPYDLNPQGANPLRDILADCVDFERVGGGADQAVRHRHQCAHRARARVPQRRADAGRAARLGLPADAVPGHRDRRRGLLGRRLCRQSDHHAVGARVRVERHDPRAGQSGRAPGHAALRPRHPQPPQRGLLQRDLAQGAAHDGAAAAGRRSRQQRGRPLGQDAHPSHLPAPR